MSIDTEYLVIGMKKLTVGKLVRIEFHNRFKEGSKLRTVVGRVKSVEKRDDKLNIVIEDALDDWTWDSRKKTKQTVEFEWTVGHDIRYYYLDKDSDSVRYDYKYIISNATDATLKALAKRLKQIHLKHIEAWKAEIEKLQKEINEYQNNYIKPTLGYVKQFEKAYKV